MVICLVPSACRRAGISCAVRRHQTGRESSNLDTGMGLRLTCEDSRCCFCDVSAAPFVESVGKCDHSCRIPLAGDLMAMRTAFRFLTGLALAPAGRKVGLFLSRVPGWRCRYGREILFPSNRGLELAPEDDGQKRLPRAHSLPHLDEARLRPRPAKRPLSLPINLISSEGSERDRGLPVPCCLSA